MKLRTGSFDEVEAFCVRMADELEPRKLSIAKPTELISWGYMLRRASAAAALNNRPSEAKEYCRLANVAAQGLGKDHYGIEIFGVSACLVQQAENFLVSGQPDRTLELAPQVKAISNGRRVRHELDVALALVQTGKCDDAASMLMSLHAYRPQWLAHQRTARAVVREILRRRVRALPSELVQVADLLDV